MQSSSSSANQSYREFNWRRTQYIDPAPAYTEMHTYDATRNLSVSQTGSDSYALALVEFKGLASKEWYRRQDNGGTPLGSVSGSTLESVPETRSSTNPLGQTNVYVGCYLNIRNKAEAYVGSANNSATATSGASTMTTTEITVR